MRPFWGLTVFIKVHQPLIICIHYRSEEDSRVSPVGACPLWCQVHPIYTVVVIIHYLGQTKVCDFDFATCRTVHQQDVTFAEQDSVLDTTWLTTGRLSNHLLSWTWFEVIVDDGGFDFVEVPQGADNLHDDGASLFLGHQLVLLQVEVQVVSFAELEDCAESEERRAHAVSQRGETRHQEDKLYANVPRCWRI